MLREYEKDQYRNKLLENIDKLMDIGIEIGDDEKCYFHNFTGNSQQPKIEGKSLKHFPNAEFLREYGIIKKAHDWYGKRQPTCQIISCFMIPDQ